MTMITAAINFRFKLAVASLILLKVLAAPFHLNAQSHSPSILCPDHEQLTCTKTFTP